MSGRKPCQKCEGCKERLHRFDTPAASNVAMPVNAATAAWMKFDRQRRARPFAEPHAEIQKRLVAKHREQVTVPRFSRSVRSEQIAGDRGRKAHRESRCG